MFSLSFAVDQHAVLTCHVSAISQLVSVPNFWLMPAELEVEGGGSAVTLYLWETGSVFEVSTGNSNLLLR